MLLFLAVVGCVHKPIPTPVPVPTPTGPRLSGTASWYADDLAGHATASGVPYKPSGMTAAHRTLPFGTIAKVTRTDTGASVTVVINDRGPFAAGRVIDLSHAAAEKLGMISSGTAPVKITLLGCDPAYPSCK